MKRMALAIMGTMMMLAGVEGRANIVSGRLPATTLLNIAYGSDPKQVMDIYLPEGRSADKTKVLFLIHGGSWSGGDKRSFTGYIDSLRNHLPEYAFVNVNYRLATLVQNKFPTQADDVKSALGFVMNKSSEYQISHQVVLLGASAGAHLALLQAYKNTDPVKALAVISFFGPTDIADLYNNPVHPQLPALLQVFLGGTPSANPDLYEQASPVYFVSSASCPTLLFQGGQDPLVNPRQATRLKQKLDSAGVINDLIFYPSEGHGWSGISLGDSFAKIAGFLRRNGL